MKRLWIIPVGIILLLLGFALGISARMSTPSSTDVAYDDQTLGVEVLPNVYDDQQSTVYIRVDDLPGLSWRGNREDAAIADVMAKKVDWERQFPDKKVIAMSIVTGDSGGYGHPIVVGLLIHYEQP